jgi:predicted DNA-binding protein
MVRTQIFLTEEQKRQLKRLAAASGKKQSEMIREAIDGYLVKQGSEGWKAAFEAARGMWTDRDDLDGFVRDLRSEWERRLERSYGR